jgi:hypothetical protein
MCTLLVYFPMRFHQNKVKITFCTEGIINLKLSNHEPLMTFWPGSLIELLLRRLTDFLCLSCLTRSTCALQAHDDVNGFVAKGREWFCG